MSPAPRKCGNCRRPAVLPVPERYETILEHDGRAYPVAVDGLVVDVCSACGNRVLGDDADERLSRALREAAGLLQPEEIRAGRERLGVTQKALAEQLRIAAATLSRWETGGQIQQRGFDTLLRLYFKLPEVRDELSSPPASVRSMNRGWSLGVGSTTVESVFAAPTRNGYALAHV